MRLTPAEEKQLKLKQLESEDAFIDVSSPSTPKFGKGEGKHRGAVTGIAVDSLNRTLISCGDDGKVKVSDVCLRRN